MPSSPRAGAALTAADKKEISKTAVEAQLEKFFGWLHRRLPALPLCRSGQHFWLSESDRSKCCNGYRRARVFLTVNGFGHVKYYWREINSTDDRPFSWEPRPTNRSSRLVVRGDGLTEARGDDHVNITFHKTHRAKSCSQDKPGAEVSNRAAVPRVGPSLSLMDAHVAGGQLAGPGYYSGSFDAESQV